MYLSAVNQTNMSILIFLLILEWSQMSGSNVIALFVVGSKENTSAMNNESCVSCFCEPTTENCNEEICTDPTSIHLCKNKTYQANTKLQAPIITFNLRRIGFIFKLFICMFVMYMFIIHTSRDCFSSSSTRRLNTNLSQILSDDGLRSTNGDDQSCVMPLNVYDNNIIDPPPSYDDLQITRTHAVSPRCTARPPVRRSDLNNYVELNTFSDYRGRSPLDDPPPSYDEFMAILHRSKSSQVHNLPSNCANDHLFRPADAIIGTARDSQTTFAPETEIVYNQSLI